MAHGKVALVTGTTSGIGRATADQLKADGYRVFEANRSTSVTSGYSVRLDVTDEASVKAGVEHVLKSVGQIELLVNNAGFALMGALEESSTEQAKEIFETNFFGVIRMTRAVLPIMRGQRYGRIVNVSSVVGFVPAPFMGLYAASKHALEGYSESLDHEVRNLGIRVSLIEPGFTKTRIDQNMKQVDQPLDVYEKSRASFLNVINHALENAADPSTAASAVLDAAHAMSPKVRYQAGREAALLRKLRRFLPASVFEKSFRKQFRLDLA